MKKLISISICFFTIFNLFAQAKISTNELKKGTHYSIDSSVNIRSDASLKSEKIGKVNLGDKIEVLEKTEVYFESEGIYDCFYKVKADCGTGYMFGGYISDNADEAVFDGKNKIYFDKIYRYSVKIPLEVEYSFLENLSKENYTFATKWYRPGADFDIFEYVEFADEEPTFDDLVKLSSILKGQKGKTEEKSLTKALIFTKDGSSIETNNLTYNKISEISLVKNQFKNATFIAMKVEDISAVGYVDATDFYTFQNGKLVNKRRFANSASEGMYHSENVFVFPNDKGGEKNTVRIIGKYFQNNKVTEEYDVKTVWNGKDFIDK